jgi:hypothetical protein
MKKLILVIALVSLASCSWLGIEEREVEVYPCLDGNCDAKFEIDPLVSPGVYKDKNDYWHIKYMGYNYFTIIGKLDELNPKYVLNKTPLVEVHWDSDYWITFDGLTFKIPIYSVLSWFNDKSFNDPIPIGTRNITLVDIAKIQPPMNIVGYQINKATCWDCPYTPRLLGTYTRYSYNTKQQIFLDKYMKGDTLRVMVKATFNTDLGPREVVEKTFDIIVDK